MNIRKGFFRLTLVVSIAIGIISAFVMIEREPYTRFKVKRSGEGVKELTIVFLWYGEKDPNKSDFFDVFIEAETTNKRVISVAPWEKYKRKEDLSWLPDQPASQNEVKKEHEPKKFIDPLDEMAKTNFTILEKTVRPIKWNRFFLTMGLGFISVWLVYVFLRWVVVAFIIGGFRHKANS